MNASHVAGGGFGAILGTLIVGLLHHFAGTTLSDVDAAVIGSAALGAGVGLGHAISTFGILGMVGILWKGNKPRPIVLNRPPTPPPAPPPAPPAG